MKYKITLNGRTYEVEVEAGKAMLTDEYEAFAPPVRPGPAPNDDDVTAAILPNAPAAPAGAPAPGPTPAAKAAVIAAGEHVEAPMPGTVLRLDIKEGQSVRRGDTLVVLEAMKMETEIPAPRDGVIAQVAVQKGSTVDTGTLLVVLA